LLRSLRTAFEAIARLLSASNCIRTLMRAGTPCRSAMPIMPAGFHRVSLVRGCVQDWTRQVILRDEYFAKHVQPLPATFVYAPSCRLTPHEPTPSVSRRQAEAIFLSGFGLPGRRL
jgi:hypothetical protein